MQRLTTLLTYVLPNTNFGMTFIISPPALRERIEKFATEVQKLAEVKLVNVYDPLHAPDPVNEAYYKPVKGLTAETWRKEICG